MTFIDSKPDPVPAILKAKGTGFRAVALFASIVGLILPAATSSAMGMSQSTSVLQLAGWFVIVPIVIGAALVVPGIAAQYSRLADIVAAVIAVAVLAYAGYAVFDAWNQVSQITGQATGMMRNMAGNNAQMQAYADSYGQKLGVGVMPGIGLAVMALSAVLMTLLALRDSK
jgi:hypothetical protein